MRRPRPVRVVPGLLALTTIAALTWYLPVQSAAANRSVTGVATAQGVRFTYTVPGLLVVETYADFGGPVAESRLGSIGSQAMASDVYPGDLAVNYPQLGTAVGLALPSYPLMASAEHPVTPEATVEGPAGYAMKAEASADRAAARAAAGASRAGTANDNQGAPASGVVGVTSVAIAADGTVTSQAETTIEGLSLGDTLRIGSVRSLARAVLDPGATAPRTEATTVVTGITVAGKAVEFGPNGLQLAGTPAPVPSGPSPADVMAQAGLSVRLVHAAGVAQGASADTVEIEDRRPLPFSGNPTGIARYRLGGATAAVFGEGVEAGPAPGSPPAGGASPGGPSALAPSTAADPPPTPGAPGLAAADRRDLEPVPFDGRVPGPLAPPVGTAGLGFPGTPSETAAASPARGALLTRSPDGPDGAWRSLAGDGPRAMRELLLVIGSAGVAGLVLLLTGRLKGAGIRWSS